MRFDRNQFLGFLTTPVFGGAFEENEERGLSRDHRINSKDSYQMYMEIKPYLACRKLQCGTLTELFILLI